MKNIINKIKEIFKSLYQAKEYNVYKPSYRLLEIINDDDVYSIRVQVINKVQTFIIKPEDILSDDHFVNQFSPIDVRTMTYLGYLGINSPKYKVLAKRVAEQGDLVFVIKQKGKNDVVLKTSEEIIKDLDLLKNLSSNDISSIAYKESQEKLLK